MREQKMNKKKKIATTSMAVLGLGLIVTGAFAALNDNLSHNETVTIEWVDIVDGSAANLALEDENDVTNTPVTELTPGITYELTGTLENDSTVITDWSATDLTTTQGVSITINDSNGYTNPTGIGESVDVSQFGITVQVDQTVTPSTDINFVIEFSSRDARNDDVPLTLAQPTAISEVFPDPALAACVASDLEGEANGDVNYIISQEELDMFSDIDCDNKGIVSLEGMQYFTNLKFLDLGTNQITDITPLAGLTTLTNLDLQNNLISDASPLAELTNLKALNLYKNDVSDLTSLANLTNLTFLNLRYNEVTDITPLAGLTNMTDLYLNNNQITDISALSNMTNLKVLGLFDNQITDLSPTINMTNLQVVYLNDNQITDFSYLTYQPTTLWAEDQMITLPDTTLGTPTDIIIDGINGEDLIITFNTPGTYVDGQLTWENPGVNSLTFASADGTITGTITQTVI